MADNHLKVESLSELQIWIGGKFELIAQSQETAHNDLSTIRSRVHDLANEVSKVSALNLPATIAELKKADEDHQANIKKFITDAAERRGAITTLKTLYTIIGACVGGALAIMFKLYEVFQQ